MCATLSEKTEALETENGRLEKRIEQLLQENAEQSKTVRTKYICLDYHLLKWPLQERYFVTLITCEYWQLRLQIIALQEDGFQLENNVDEHKDDQHSIKDEVFYISSRKFRHRSTDIRPFFNNSAKC